MLGFELAGIILAIIPLYDEAVTIAGVKKMVEANRERRQIAGKLLVVNATLRHATLRLFHKLDPDLTLDQWDALEAQGVTGSKFLDIWREISEACPAVRNEELWLAIEETLKNVATALVKVLKHTKIEDAATGLREIITEHEKNPKPFSKGSVFERFMFGASDRNRSRQLKDLSEATGNLLMFTKFVAAENRDTRAHSRAASENHKRYVRDLNNVRTHCRKLYGCLFNHWKCECHLSRRAMLKLENRTSDINLHFSIILAFENPSDDCWGYQKTRISIYDPSQHKEKRVTYADYRRLADRVDETSNLAQLGSICNSLPDPSSEDEIHLNLVLHAETENFYVKQPSHDSSIKINKQCKSLETRLRRNVRPALRPTICLPLAINLASSLLQLHTTPWLSETWCKNSIYFPLDNDDPYVTVDIDEHSHHSTSNLGNILNPYLVGLGIVLLELAEGKSMEEWMRERAEISVQPSNITEKARIGSLWLRESQLADRYKKYSEVVDLCLRCLFEPPPLNKSLEDESFQQIVYRDIISQLEQMYEMSETPVAQK